MRRYSRLLFASLALLGAFYLTAYREGSRGLWLDVNRPIAAQTRLRAPYDLSSLNVLNKVVVLVKENYVEPKRIDPRKMLQSALDYVQRNVAEVMIEHEKGSDKLVVKVADTERHFPVDDVTSPWALSMKLKEIFRFMQTQLQSSSTDLRDIEYSAINGMLSTLDPHSILLKPEVYNEMRLSTKGEFGGLGIVISIKDGLLTVVSPIEGTPASRAGVKELDRIVKIGEESTINMTLNEAVSRLRGAPGTKVIIWLERKGWSEPKRFVLEREMIQIKSVESRVLQSNIGYLRIKNFQGNTYKDLRTHLEKLDRAHIKGLVLDMRNNPGGLLNQAIKVADAFIESGTLVTTVGYGARQREEKRATASGREPHYPIAVLINGGSASASEIVAGALKNLDRAIIVGQPSFGKGSVQVLYDNDDGSALKLTIAQYLTPGDISIQSVGIVPDIQADPALVKKDEVDLFRDDHSLREKDLSEHLQHASARRGEKPKEIIRFFHEPLRKKKLAAGPGNKKPKDSKDAADDDDDKDKDDDDLPPPDKFVEDFEIKLGRDILIGARGSRRPELLQEALPVLEKKRLEEATKIAAALKKLGVDWGEGPGPAGKPALPIVELTTDKAQNRVQAGEKISLILTARNPGSATFYQLRATTKSDNPLFTDRELVIGKLRPGEKRSWKVSVKIPKDTLNRVDSVAFKFNEQHGLAPSPAEMKVQLAGLERPLFAYSYQVVDDEGGNGDGLLQKGETVKLLVTVKNIGKGKSFETLATMKNLGGDGIYVKKGRFNINDMLPGQTRTVGFEFKVRPELEKDKFQLEMSVIDTVLREIVTEKLDFRVRPAVSGGNAAGMVRINRDGVEVRGGAEDSSALIGHVYNDAVFKSLGRRGAWVVIELEKGRPGFVRAAHTEATSQQPRQRFQAHLMIQPPVIELKVPELHTRAAEYNLSGVAVNDRNVKDLYIFISNRKAKVEVRKVFYTSNRRGPDPRRLSFRARIPLFPGPNNVIVVAREKNDVQSKQHIVLYRDTGAPVQAATH